MDADAYRRDSRHRWGASARGWKSRGDIVRTASMPVSMWMVDAIHPQPGHRVLELAAGPGEVGFLAHELIQPGGELICSDFAPEMVTVAQERAAELGLHGVRFKQIDAESIDLDAGSVDGVLCRWGYMLMADPGAALRETRRVLRPGGRVALASWADPAENPWASLIGAELARREAVEPPRPDEPGQFAWSQAGRVRSALEDAGFGDIEVESVSFRITYSGADDWLAGARALGARFREALDALAEDADLRAALRGAAAPYTLPDGSLDMPAKCWVGAATA